MITLSKESYIPVLSIIAGNPKIIDCARPDAPKVILTRAGMCFEQAVKNWAEKFPQIIVHNYVIMPDHIHLCIDVRGNLLSGLSRAIASLMGNTSSIYGKKFFTKGFTDSIAFTETQFEIQQKYIQANPRRLLIKRLHSDFFFKRWEICVNNLCLKAIGNIFLLKNPHIQVVRFSRKYTEDQVKSNIEKCHICVENGGVLISPFIHPAENELKKYAIENDGKIIRIVENGFAERFSPSKSEFEMLSSGRLLLIASKEYDTHKEKMRYSYAQYLNSLAEMLASLNSTPAKIRPLL